MASKLLPKILAILEHHGYVWTHGKAPDDVQIQRIRAGAGDRMNGAWSWALWSATNPGETGDIGSQWPATEIAKWGPDKVMLYTNKFGQTSIDPTKETIQKQNEQRRHRVQAQKEGRDP
ncbi:hypothetical protein [Myxococcus phage Mx1]|nr:hypothetical protein [Myxococcus phage Mx1]